MGGWAEGRKSNALPPHGGRYQQPTTSKKPVAVRIVKVTLVPTPPLGPAGPESRQESHQHPAASSSIQQHPAASASILNNRREAATGRRRQQIGSSPSRASRNEDVVVFTARHAPSKSIIHSIPILIDNLALSSMQMTLVLHIGAMAWLNDVERRCRRFIRVKINLVKFIAILNSTSNRTLED